MTSCSLFGPDEDDGTDLSHENFIIYAGNWAGNQVFVAETATNTIIDTFIVPEECCVSTQFKEIY